MGSYNRLNGEYVCQRSDLLNLPRRLWGWAGVSVPDFIFAVRDARAALAAGLDLPALGDAGGRTSEDLLEIGEDALDEIVLHVLTAAEQARLRRPQPAQSVPPEGSADLARRIAAEGMVLLSNDTGILPLAAASRVAVIDAVGARNVLVMGGAPSVSLVDARIPTVAGALAEALGSSDQVTALHVGHGERSLPPFEAGNALGGIEAVVRADVTGDEHSRQLSRFELSTPDGVAPDWSATVRTTYRAERAGLHTLTLEFAGRATLYTDEKQLVTGFREASPMVTGPEYPLHAVVDLDAGQTLPLRVEYATSVAIGGPGAPMAPHLRLGIAGPDDRLAEAAALAADCDVAVVLAGRLSGEAMDVESLALPGIQEAVVSAVVAANPRTVLVTFGAGPVVLPSQLAPAALLHAWFPGEQFAPALADVLTARQEPGGRLPITFPVDEQSTPIQDPAQYPGVDGVSTYSEGLLVGYRWYDERGVDPAFPFGHGSGYTTFEMNGLKAAASRDGVRLQFTLRNVGSRSGKAVPQIYVRYPPGADEPGAPLKGFDAVRLEAGGRRDLMIDIALDDLKIFDEQTESRILSAGEYEFRAGFSSRDVRTTAVLDIPLETSSEPK
jgi:beta-glucosidase